MNASLPMFTNFHMQIRW